MKKENFIILIMLLVTFAITFSLYYFIDFPEKDSQNNHSLENYVINIVNGDTFNVLINGSEKKVRLLCVNSPKYGESNYESSKYYLMKNILHKQVLLKKGIKNKDEQGNLLRYVYVNSTIPTKTNYKIKKTFINQELLKRRYSEFYNNDESCNNFSIV